MTKKTKRTKKRKHDKKQSHDKGRVNSFISRHKILISLLVVISFCLLLRFLHLLNSDHYYILSHDSYYFHWISKRYLLGETTDRIVWGQPYIPNIWHNGLSYPLGWLSIALSSISWLSRAEALTWACKLLPPLLGVIMALLIYWMGSRMYSRATGIFAAFSWAVLSSAIYITSAGYLDRDPLSLLLVTAGLLVFYLSKDWHLRIGKLNLGWLLGGLLVVGIETFLFLEWTLTGPILFLGLLTAYFAAVFLARLYANVVPITGDAGYLSRVLSSIKLVPAKIVPALRETNWRPFAVLVSLNLLALLIVQDFAPSRLFDRLGDVFSPDIGLVTTSEMQGMGLSGLFMYIFLSVPLLIGIYHTLIKRRPSDILWLTWFVLFFIIGFFARRTFIIYATVPGCMLAGIGLGIIYSYQRSYSYQQLQKIIAQLLLVVVIFLSAVVSLNSAYQQGSGRLVAPEKDWQLALAELKKTPEDAVIMTWWDYGYWILDLAERSPVVDNGFRPESYLNDVAGIYFTSTDQDSEAVEVMQRYGASYIVFSTYEVDIIRVIKLYANKPLSEDILYTRALGTDFQSDVFSVFYENDTVVILSIK